jgi:uncharacterized membrane protein required for colicin V production
LITDWYTVFCVFLVLLNIVRSAIRGFSKEFLSFAGLVIGFVLGLSYYSFLGNVLNRLVGWHNSWIFNLVGFLAIFIPVIMFFSWIGILFRKVFERLDIVWVDAVLGFLMGIVKGMFWILVITLLVLNFSYLQFLTSYVYQSRFYQDLTLPVITYLHDWMVKLPQAHFLSQILERGIPKEDANLGNFKEF